MAEYDEFRIQVEARAEDPASWDVSLLACPLPGLIGPKGTSRPVLTRRQLRRLRNRNGWPNLGELVQTGAAVWRSIMTADLEAALQASLEVTRGRGLQLALLAPPAEATAPASLDAPVAPSELPVEALYEDRLGFLALDVNTPVFRALGVANDRPPRKIAGQLRVLVAVSAPTDKPSARMADELRAIEDALRPLTRPNGPLALDVCQQPTRLELSQRVRSCDVFHFIGHGGFDIIGGDPTPQAYIALARPDAGESDPLTAYDLSNLLHNTGVQLAVLTACVSALPRPDEEPYPVGAFNGMAQRMLTGVSNVSAAVAMQFDMEADAAVAFSGAFYQHLLKPGEGLMEVVTWARKEVAICKTTGHRAWVTPVVYCRNVGAQVFDFAATAEASPAPISPPDGANVDLPALRDAMVGAFTVEDLEDLCMNVQADLARDGFALPVNLDMVGSRGKSGQIRELILYLEHRGFLAYLVKAVLRARPSLRF